MKILSKKFNLFNLKILLVLILTISLASALETKSKSDENFDFFQQADSAIITKIPGKTNEFKITLYRVDPKIKAYSERPYTDRGKLANETFIKYWYSKIKESFAKEPPSVIITWDERGKKRRTDFGIIISKPEYNAKAKTMSYHLHPFKEEDMVPLLSKKLKRVELFIDSAPLVGWMWGG